MTNKPLLERLSWISAIVGAIAALIGLFFLFAPAKIEPQPAQINQSGISGTVVGVSNGQIVINQALQPAPEEALLTHGRWDDEVANALVTRSLSEAEQRLKPELCSGFAAECKIKHSEIGRYSLVYNSKEVMLLIWASIEDDELQCHGCAPFISIFEFEKRPNGWKHSQSDVGVFQWGSWGSMDAANVVARPIGPNKFGIVFDLGFTQGGHSEYALAIWANLGDSYRKILHIRSATTDSGTLNPGKYSWESKVKYLNADSGLFPIEISTHGKIDGKPIKTNSILEFNGVEYRGRNLPEHLELLDCIKKDVRGECQ